MKSLKISKYETGLEVLIYRLVKKVFDEFVATDYTDEGNRFFYDWIQPSKIAERQLKDQNILIAKVGSEIVGMIEIRDNNTISLLFVDKAYQRQGIAGKLFARSLANCLKRNSALNKFYVNASPYSVPVYQKLGFSEIKKMQVKFGIKYFPMEMNITKQTNNQ